jgi:hypothetical protein
MSTNDELSERQAPSNDSQAWEDRNFIGLYTSSNSTFSLCTGTRTFKTYHENWLFYSRKKVFANGITQRRYTSNSTTSNPWVANNFGFSQPKGSTFAMALVSFRSAKHLMLYTVDDGKNLRQHEYTISDTDLGSKTVVYLTLESGKSPALSPTLWTPSAR